MGNPISVDGDIIGEGLNATGVPSWSDSYMFVFPLPASQPIVKAGWLLLSVTYNADLLIMPDESTSSWNSLHSNLQTVRTESHKCA